MTYQSLCQLDDPSAAIRQVAAARWATDRAAATGVEVEEATAEGLAYEGTAAERRAAEIARITAAVKREIARGEHAEIELAELFSETARKRIDAFKAARIGTIVLDECHHLASMWGYVVRAVLDELRELDVHVIGLTATPPSDLTGAEDELYAELLGPVDFTVPTPAVVREGFLAPYQELAWLTEPLDSERAWLAEHDTRFKELITALHEDAEGPRSFPALGDQPHARAPPQRRRRRPDVVGGLPARAPGAGAGRRALPRLGGAGAAGRRAARRVLSAPAEPRGLARAARGLRAALPARLPRSRGGRPLRRRGSRAWPSSASSSRGAASAVAPRRSTGC